MHITIRQLQVFEAVARRLSYTRAAEELHLTQPAVSMQVKQLEGSVGLPLFEQMGKKIYLTQAGDVMLVHARTIMQHLASAAEEMNDLRGVDSGRLRIAIASTVNYFATQLLATFAREHPAVEIFLDVTNRESLLSRLEDNIPDLVLMGKPPVDMDLVSESFMDNPLIMIAAPDHPMVKQREITLADLAQEHFLVRESGSGTRAAMERFFSEQSFEYRKGMELTGNEAVKQGVEAGLGLAIVSAHTVEQELTLKRLVALKVQGLPIMRRWYIAHRRGKRLSVTAKAFRRFVLDTGVRDA
ncbi:MAG: LysR family transcriptional regulator [Acidiferrobacteraceae bacterium]|jgi:DNA-binding transcriptional LysR family regulator|nr:LysR family transcriptional regulator [Acidiferrobacteraceae bacterium]MCP4830556.1 LysR family transcriptional regulator [Pseudomonadota bacterium]HJP07954.1 LysR family transcriptional regulator [Arenicellales bacterium]|tara:strand:- start:2496 stop:3392 length:897 start_codon:yes stop_codon:yes gene_type:complete